MNAEDRDKLLLRIGDARLSISIKDNLTPMDRKIDSVLKDCAAVLQSQDIRLTHDDGEEQPSKCCYYYAKNNKKPYCTHDCDGCMWYM